MRGLPMMSWRLTMWVLRLCTSDKRRLMVRSVLGRLNRALVGIEDTSRIYMLN
jgi:hypothetical protein